MWAGIRTKAALESESSWYQVQRAGSVPLICLAVAYVDSGLLFIIQGIYHEAISPLIPVGVFSAQSLVGIIWIYMASRNSDPLKNQSKASEVSERNKKVNSVILVRPIISSEKRDVAVERALASLCARGSLSKAMESAVYGGTLFSNTPRGILGGGKEDQPSSQKVSRTCE